VEILGTKVHTTFSGEVTVESSKILVDDMIQCVSHGVKQVVLDVTTPGGEVASGVKLHEVLSSMPMELITRNTSEVASIGNILFLAGEIRLASPEARFFLHPLTFRAPAGCDLDYLRKRRTKLEFTCGSQAALRELDIGIAKLEREEQHVQRIIEQRTKLTIPEIRSLVREHRTLSAPEAQTLGIVHDIIPPHKP
jgi:ATP-dependent protease ClpP protease subunit